MRAVSARNQLSLLPKIGERFGEWSEAPSYEEGVLGQAKRAELERGLMEVMQGEALQKKEFNLKKIIL